MFNCMWLLDTLKYRSCMDPQFNPSLDSSILEADLSWSFVLTGMERTQYYSVPFRSFGSTPQFS